MGTFAGQRIGAGVAVLSRGRVLLVRRQDNGLWDIPGGGVEEAENSLDAARRECYEETGLEVKGVTILGVFSGPTHQHTYPDGNVVEWVTALFLARDFTETPTAGDDAAEVRWWPLTDLPVAVSAATAAYFAALHHHPEATS